MTIQVGSAGAVARHHIANTLHEYVDIADRKDVDAACALLGRARVILPAGGFDLPEDARQFFTDLWASPTPHRHDVSNLVVLPGESGSWVARAHYTRWLLDPEPVVHTLGEYTVEIDEKWSVVALTVTRTWTRT